MKNSSMDIDEAIQYHRERENLCSKCGGRHTQMADWLDELKALRNKHMEVVEKGAYKEAYTNLTRSLREELIEPILGQNYYNYSCDRYTCDTMICKDIREEFRHIKTVKNFFMWLSLISTVGCITSVIINVLSK